MDQLVIGIGEIGEPLLHLLNDRGARVFGRDKDESKDFLAGFIEQADVIHICFPFSDEFVNNVVEYIRQYGPSLVIVHSTVVPGTVREIAMQSARLWPIAYSPVRGRHGSMQEDMLRYRKFVTGIGAGWQDAMPILERAGFHVNEFRSSVEGLELAKLLETSYSALLISWAQEMARYCNEVEADYMAVNSFFLEVPWHPGYIFKPGVIGGHCLLPNLDLLEKVQPSGYIDAIRQSNELFQMEGGTTERQVPLSVAEVMREYFGD